MSHSRKYYSALAKKERFLVQGSSLEGGEATSSKVSRKGDVRVVLCYPNRYWLGMSNLGFQTVYRLLSEVPRFQVERAFLPENTGERTLTFETGAMLSQADILAFSVSFETDYPNILTLLEHAGVSLNGRVLGSRGDDRFTPLLLGGGAALTLNPEPVAAFFDAIVIGEGEEVVREISSSYLQARNEGLSRESVLESVASIDGVYVPSLYDVQYHADETVKKFVSERARVKRRYVKNIDAFPTYTVIQTPETEFRSMFMTETGRGCEVGCRFCVAGYMYRPTRKRSETVLSQTVQIGVENSESIGFVGAAVSSHPAIAQLASSVSQKGKRAALSSIMSQRVTPALAASLSESEYKTVALAPEAGSETLRFRVGKRVCDEQIIGAVSTLAREGIRNFKLYFIVGLPSEEASDVLAIVSLVKKIAVEALKSAVTEAKSKIAPKIILSVNPFIPKAWTPFQRHQFLSLHELNEKLDSVRSGIRGLANVEMKAESPRESYFQTLMSRGDRRVAKLLLWLHQEQRDWRSFVKYGKKVLVSGVPCPDFYVTRQMGQNELLPWEVVDLLVKRELLEREYQETFEEDVQPIIARRREEYFKKEHKKEQAYKDSATMMLAS